MTNTARVSLALLLLGPLSGCGRTMLLDTWASGQPSGGRDAAVDLPPDAALPDGAEAPVDLPPDLSLPQPDGAGPDATSEVPVSSCVPTEEICNGIDDDCDGATDEDLPAVPCPGGGSRFCVAGRLSACPVRCEVCLPGSTRICFIPYCTYWGEQTCASDGTSFGVCREVRVPGVCSSVSSSKKNSPELEQCCIDSGHCCLDEYDLDHDGDRTEMLGRCDGVTC